MTLRQAPADRHFAAAPQGPLQDLVHCLEAEYRALLAEDLPELERVLQRKQQLLADLANKASPTSPGSPQGSGAGAPLTHAAAQLRALNERNAQVMAPRAAGNRARLQFLQAALGRSALYAQDGSTHTVGR